MSKKAYKQPDYLYDVIEILIVHLLEMTTVILNPGNFRRRATVLLPGADGALSIRYHFKFDDEKELALRFYPNDDKRMGVSGHCYNVGKQVTAFKEFGLSEEMKNLSDTLIKVVLCTPIIMPGKTKAIGVLAIDSYNEKDYANFTEPEFLKSTFLIAEHIGLMLRFV